MSYSFPEGCQVVRKIYSSKSTQVYLVRSLKRRKTLVAKCIKKSSFAGDIYFEANLLRALQHPGIPNFCETIENDEAFILLEEFVPGDALDRYLRFHQQISRENFLNIAIQLCGIFEYLHSRRPHPVLYLDLKPSHIILDGDRVTLIDYGIAKYLPNSGTIFQIYGTKNFAAPEQLKGEPLGLFTDVYSVGKVLAFMLGYLSKKDARGLRWIVHCATRKNPKRRTKSISVLKKQLERRQKKKRKKNLDREHLNARIAVVGTDRGVGCTHFAIALVTYLNQAGFTAHYRNQTEQKVLETMEKQLSHPVNKDGFIYHETFVGATKARQGNMDSLLGIQVVDCGCHGQVAEADIRIFVCGGRLWQQSRPSRWECSEKDLLIANFFGKEQARELARNCGHPVILFPFQRNPFVTSLAEKRVFSEIVKTIL